MSCGDRLLSQSSPALRSGCFVSLSLSLVLLFSSFLLSFLNLLPCYRLVSLSSSLRLCFYGPFLHAWGPAPALAPTMSSSAVTTTTAATTQVQGVRHPVRQTRTNPSRTSKTVGRASLFYGRSSAIEAPQAPAVPHGLYPALSHFTDAITALPREYRRHFSLLKEVDAKAWALEENLQQLLKIASSWEPGPVPSNPAPIVDGVIKDYGGSKVS
jgi:hypothetical protein